jgi:hypothetical protein
MRLADSGAPIALKRRAVNWSTKLRTFSIYCIRYRNVIFSTRATCPVHFALADLVTLADPNNW